MRFVHSVAMLAIATGVAGTITGVNAASPLVDTQIAESKDVTAKGSRTGGVISKGTDTKAGTKPNSIQQQIQSENQRIKSGTPK